MSLIRIVVTGAALLAGAARVAAAEKALADGERDPEEVVVAVELRLLAIPDGYGQFVEGENLWSTGRQVGKWLHDARSAPIRLSEAELKTLLESLYGDRRTELMCLTRVAAFDGQRAAAEAHETRRFVTGVKGGDEAGATVETTKVTLGARFRVRPVVAADQSSVSLRLQGAMTNLIGVDKVPVRLAARGGDAKPRAAALEIEKPRIEHVKFDRSARLADGQTMITEVGRVTREEWYRTYDPLFMRDVPYLGELFAEKRLARTSDPVLLLATVRVVGKK